MNRRGFTLLEIMVAVAILGLGLTAILSAQAGAFASAAHARHVSQATGLARCKMLEVEESLLRTGFQAADSADEGPCCDGDETIPMHCAWRVEVPTLPTPEYGQLDLQSALDPSALGPLAGLMAPGGAKNMFGSSSSVTDVAQQLFGAAAAAPGVDPAAAPPVDPDGGAGLLAGATDPNAAAGGGASPMNAIAGVVMGMVYPDLKTYFEASTRRITVDLSWREGNKTYTLTIEQWIAQPQQGLPDDEDEQTSETEIGGETGAPADGKGTRKSTHGPIQSRPTPTPRPRP